MLNVVQNDDNEDNNEFVDLRYNVEDSMTAMN